MPLTNTMFALQAEFGQEIADGVEDDVVTAFPAPADLLVAGEVLALLGLVGGRYAAVLDIGVRPSSWWPTPLMLDIRSVMRQLPSWLLPDARIWPCRFPFRPAFRRVRRR